MLTPDEYATPEQIQKNLERIKKIGDRDQTVNMFAAEEAAQAEADFERREANRKRYAEGLDLPLFST